MNDLHDYQVDHLLLLVGSNPLPNAVAGKLLVAAGGIITLIHSQDSCSLANQLRAWLLDADGSMRNIARIDLREVEASDAASVYSAVKKALEESKTMKTGSVRVGLNYTGGTKVMSVHAYRALVDWARSAKGQSQERETVFSYLDAHTLRMRFDEAPGRDEFSLYVGRSVEISIAALVTMHGWKFKQTKQKESPHTDPVLHTVPILPKSASALLSVHSSAPDAKSWTTWLKKTLFPVARRHVVIQSPFWVLDESKKKWQAGEGAYKVEQPDPSDQWKCKTELRAQTISWPNLPVLMETMQNELGQGGAEKLTLDVSNVKDFRSEEAFCKWLSGTWLESAVLLVLQGCSEELQLRDCCMNLNLLPYGGGGDFEFDVVAIRGYQLFAFSCTTEDGSGGRRGILKNKLFELYIRARQMGGDEACAALVCCMGQEKADKLELEVRHDIGAEERIRVFGREQLENLSFNIENWIREQSKEE